MGTGRRTSRYRTHELNHTSRYGPLVLLVGNAAFAVTEQQFSLLAGSEQWVGSVGASGDQFAAVVIANCR